MKIEIEPEVVLAVIKHLDKRSQKEAEKMESILTAAMPAILQFVRQGRPFAADPDPDREQTH